MIAENLLEVEMADSTDGNGELKQQPVYVSYPTFKNTIRGWGADGHALPGTIDKSLLSTMSGTAQALFLAALEEFGLLSSDNSPTERLKHLAGCDDQAWKEELSRLLKAQRPRAVELLENGTPAQLEEDLAGGFGSSVKLKAVRFFTAAAEDAGLAIAKHHKKKTGSSAPRSASKARKRKVETPASGQANPPPASDPEMMHFPIYLPDRPEGKLSLPRSIEPDDLPMIEAILTQAKLYAERQASQKAKGGGP